MTIEASKTDLSIADVPENEVFSVDEFGEFRIRLCNGESSGGMVDIVDFEEWVKRNRRD